MDFCQLEDDTDSTRCGRASQETRGSLISDMGMVYQQRLRILVVATDVDGFR